MYELQILILNSYIII